MRQIQLLSGRSSVRRSTVTDTTASTLVNELGLQITFVTRRPDKRCDDLRHDFREDRSKLSYNVSSSLLGGDRQDLGEQEAQELLGGLWDRCVKGHKARCKMINVEEGVQCYNLDVLVEPLVLTQLYGRVHSVIKNIWLQ